MSSSQHPDKGSPSQSPPLRPESESAKRAPTTAPPRSLRVSIWVALVLAPLAYYNLLGGGVPNLALGAAACLIIFAVSMVGGESALLPRAPRLAGLLTLAAFLGAAYFSTGCWVLMTGLQAPDGGFVTRDPVHVFTLIESPDDRLRHEARLKEVIEPEVSSARIAIAAVNDPRVTRVDAKVVGKVVAEPQPRASELHHELAFPTLEPGPLELLVSARITAPIDATKPVHLLVFFEQGKRDVMWQLARWFRTRHAT